MFLKAITRFLAPLLLVALVGGCSQPATPDVSFTTLDGQSSRLSALRGKVVLVNFWATTCTTCVAEMPKLVATHNKFAAQGFETLAIAMSYDPPDYVRNYARNNALPFKVAVDASGEAAKGFDDHGFALQMLEEEDVLIVPGTSFNVPYRDHFRVTLLPEAPVLREVFARVDRVLSRRADDVRRSAVA